MGVNRRGEASDGLQSRLLIFILLRGLTRPRGIPVEAGTSQPGGGRAAGECCPLSLRGDLCITGGGRWSCLLPLPMAGEGWGEGWRGEGLCHGVTQGSLEGRGLEPALSLPKG